jgi:hypothetical protein
MSVLPAQLRCRTRSNRADKSACSSSIPEEAVQVWLAKAATTTGPVFRSVLNGGHMGGPLPEPSVAIIAAGAE